MFTLLLTRLDSFIMYHICYTIYYLYIFIHVFTQARRAYQIALNKVAAAGVEAEQLLDLRDAAYRYNACK